MGLVDLQGVVDEGAVVVDECGLEFDAGEMKGKGFYYMGL
ncbi:MAG: hypothetical protein AEth_01466 [Candidatus Argoarchaeum ethanivorans]|uniref:Uncharacterized protein n=1 Tax=Candidatus Argoarchaeum ethanivorans TaxID=2608793 RepID=A0A8B3S2A6_9EURY|nr:MAG: hypothetical protein AEth_01466 [Candidatus Argoarchaeum ethanivorans]